MVAPVNAKLISAPASYPISLVEAKEHLRVGASTTDRDNYINGCIAAATDYVEQFLGRRLIDQTWELYLDAFPTTGDMQIKIPFPPLISVLQVAYDDPSGFEQIIATGNYYVDNVSEPGWVVLQTVTTWPTPIDAINSVRVRFRAGYLSTGSPQVAAVPPAIKQAILLLIAEMFEHRETSVVGAIVSAMPWSAEQLLRQYRILLGMA